MTWTRIGFEGTPVLVFVDSESVNAHLVLSVEQTQHLADALFEVAERGRA